MPGVRGKPCRKSSALRVPRALGLQGEIAYKIRLRSAVALRRGSTCFCEGSMQKHTTRAIRLGGLSIGGGAPVMVQSMTNTDTRDAEATLAQIARLEARG